jgi:hypothetical protein
MGKSTLIFSSVNPQFSNSLANSCSIAYFTTTSIGTTQSLLIQCIVAAIACDLVALFVRTQTPNMVTFEKGSSALPKILQNLTALQISITVIVLVGIQSWPLIRYSSLI